MTDATGKEVIIGDKYGYTNTQKGEQYITIGEVLKVDKETSKAHILIKERYVTNFGLKPTKLELKRKSTFCMSHILFKIY